MVHSPIFGQRFKESKVRRGAGQGRLAAAAAVSTPVTLNVARRGDFDHLATLPFESFEEGNHVSDLPRIETKLRHCRMACHDTLG